MARISLGPKFLHPLVIFYLTLLFADEQSAAGQELDSIEFVALTFPHLSNETDVEHLNAGQPITGTLDAREERFIRFGLTELQDKGYPDLLVWFNITNQDGNADLQCGPWRWLTGSESPIAGEIFPWKSKDVTARDGLFLPSRSEEYQAAITNATITRNNGTEQAATVAAFVCRIFGLSHTGTDFELGIDTIFNGLQLVDRERDAVRSIVNQCCWSDELCSGWPDTSATEGAGGEADDEDGFHVSTNLCHVPGNLCDVDGRLIKLSFRGFKLRCAFPVDELAVLTRLWSLDASANEFDGTIDTVAVALRNASNLRQVFLASSGLGGSLPDSQELCDLVSNGTEVLQLQENNIFGRIPECLLAAGSSLQEIDLSRNLITGSVPDVFTDSSPLTSIIIANTRLSGTIPQSLANAKFLSVVNLTNNLLTGDVPEGLEGLSGLSIFAVGDNRLKSLPRGWGNVDKLNLESLVVVDISRNLLEGVFPHGLGNSKNLNRLDLQNNRLSGLLPDGTHLFPTLEHLNISFNNFEGSIPDSWSHFGIFSIHFNPPMLGMLDARNNSLSGELPDFFFTNLRPESTSREVRMSGNNVSCPAKRALFSLVTDVCPGGSDEAEIDEELAANIRRAPGEVDFEEDVGAQLHASGENDTGRGGANGSSASTANIIAAVVMGCVGGFVFVLIVAFIFYWRRRKNMPRDNLMKHVKLHDDLELSQQDVL